MPLAIEEVSVTAEQCIVRRILAQSIIVAGEEVRVAEHEIAAFADFVSSQDIDFMTKILASNRATGIKWRERHVVRTLIAICQSQVVIPGQEGPFLAGADRHERVQIVEIPASEQVHKAVIAMAQGKQMVPAVID